ncbi:MAG: hypothetical protein P8168_01380 [Deltaproteobacteria bacterium]
MRSSLAGSQGGEAELRRKNGVPKLELGNEDDFSPRLADFVLGRLGLAVGLGGFGSAVYDYL